MSLANPTRTDTLFGHPAGLYTLFFAEMWERFSYYGMRALLVFYMTKGFLGYGDGDAYTVYGAYTALVYMTPFFGGMLADRLLGARRAVVFGGLLMAAGQGLLMVPDTLAFYTALALLIAGNGFFKPNISTIVGSLYDKYPTKRDGGFTIFYMGINLGAAMSPLLCGFIGETYGWAYGFGLATIGMLTGLVVFVLPAWTARIAILGGALAAAVGLVRFHPIEFLPATVNFFVAIALVTAAIIASVALARGGLPAEAGAPRDRQQLRRLVAGVLPLEWAVYAATFLLVPVIVLFVSSGSVARSDGRPITFVSDATIESLERSEHAITRIGAVCLKEVSKPAGLILALSGLLAFGYLGIEAVRLDLLARHRMYVIFILTFFSMMFWAFFEQAGSSLNNFTDRNVNRVLENSTQQVVTPAEVGQTVQLQPTQAQLGYHDGDQLFTLDALNELRGRKDRDPSQTLAWTIAPDNIGMRIARAQDEIPASLFQAANPIYILLFGLVFTALWSFLGARGLEPSTPLKFSLGLLQLALGFAVFWLGSERCDPRGMVAVQWLLFGYLLHTTGELCLSPVGLAMVTKLSPARLVSTVMGAWFLATAFSQFLAAIIAQFTRVGGDGGAASNAIPAPIDTVHVYGNVFGQIAIAAAVSAGICFALVPMLKKWMHENEPATA